MIPTLPIVLDPTELSKHLDVFSSAPWNWGQITKIEVLPLKWSHQNRYTVEILLHGPNALHTLIGKVDAQDRSAVYQAMQAITRAGFGPEAEFSIPQPLAFLPALNLLLTEKIEGVRAKEIFMRGTEREGVEAAGRCALWLARFHALGPRSGPVLDLNRYLIRLEQWSDRIAQMGEPLASKARRLFSQLELAASALGPVETCAGHGSYKPVHVILSRGRTNTCDWDRFDVADPCRDVARFVVALERLAWRGATSTRVVDVCARVFLKTYMSAGLSKIASRLPFYKAAMCIQVAKFDLSQPVSTWRLEMEALLDKGLSVIGEGK